VITAVSPTLSEQRQALCLQLQAQRRLIAQQLGSGPTAPRDFPRSMTMRLLGQRPGTLISLVAGLLTLIRKF